MLRAITHAGPNRIRTSDIRTLDEHDQMQHSNGAA